MALMAATAALDVCTSKVSCLINIDVSIASIFLHAVAAFSVLSAVVRIERAETVKVFLFFFFSFFGGS